MFDFCKITTWYRHFKFKNRDILHTILHNLQLCEAETTIARITVIRKCTTFFFRAALIPNLPILQVPSILMLKLMYSQVQVSIPIHGNTIECVVEINFVFDILA